MKTLSLNPSISHALILILLLILSFFIIGCQDEDEPSLEGSKYSISDIAGNWTASFALFSSLEAGNPASLDIIDEGGSLKMTVTSKGEFTITISIPGEPDEIVKGQFGFEDEWLAVSYDDAPGEYDYFFIDMNSSKTKLTLRGEGSYDFDDDGDEELSSINLELDKD